MGDPLHTHTHTRTCTQTNNNILLGQIKIPFCSSLSSSAKTKHTIKHISSCQTSLPKEKFQGIERRTLLSTLTYLYLFSKTVL